MKTNTQATKPTKVLRITMDSIEAANQVVYHWPIALHRTTPGINYVLWITINTSAVEDQMFLQTCGVTHLHIEVTLWRILQATRAIWKMRDIVAQWISFKLCFSCRGHTAIHWISQNIRKFISSRLKMNYNMGCFLVRFL